MVGFLYGSEFREQNGFCEIICDTIITMGQELYKMWIQIWFLIVWMSRNLWKKFQNKTWCFFGVRYSSTLNKVRGSKWKVFSFWHKPLKMGMYYGYIDKTLLAETNYQFFRESFVKCIPRFRLWFLMSLFNQGHLALARKSKECEGLWKIWSLGPNLKY